MNLLKHRAGLALLVLGALIPLTFAGGVVAATPSTVNLGTADNFAILAGSTITDVPTSTITGDVGLSPATGASITGLTCAEVTGTIYTVDAAGPACRVTNPGLLTTAKNALTTAYNDAAGRTPDTTFAGADNQLGGQTLAAGVYRFGHGATANLIGNLTLTGDASSVWIFQATSDLIVQGSSTVTLAGEAQACNVFWQVGTSATIKTSAKFVGTVMADQSIALQTGATLQGRALARIAAVTLDTNTINRPSCASGGSGSGSGSSGTAAPADVGVVKTASTATAAVGGRVTYTSVVTNHGPGTATNVAFEDALPAGQTLVSVSTTNGSCAGTTTIRCALGTLALDRSATVVIVVTASTAGSFTNTASIRADQADQNVGANNTSSVAVTVGTTPVPPPPPAPAPKPKAKPKPKPTPAPAKPAVVKKPVAAATASPALPAKHPRGFTG